jgi:hypothetical protein
MDNLVKLRELTDALHAEYPTSSVNPSAFFGSLLDIFLKKEPHLVCWIKDTKGVYQHCNTSFIECFGVPNYKEKTDIDIFGDTVVAKKIQESDAKVLKENRVMEFREIAPTIDGSTSEWLVMKFPLELYGQKLVGGFAIPLIDVTIHQTLSLINEE